MQFLFSGLRIWPEVKKDSPDFEFSQNFVKLWVSFAQNHKPTYLWGSNLETPIEPVNSTAEKHNWLQIDNELTVEPESDEFLKDMKVMDEICEHDFDLCSSLHMK